MLFLHTRDCSMSQFQSRLTHNEEALGGSLQPHGIQKMYTHPQPHRHKKMVCRSSMTSGNTKLIDLAKLVAVFLYLNSMKPWQDTWGMMLREERRPSLSLRVTERPKTRVSTSYQQKKSTPKILFNTLSGQDVLFSHFYRSHLVFVGFQETLCSAVRHTTAGL